MPIWLYYVISSHFILAVGCHGSHLVKRSFHLTFVVPLFSVCVLHVFVHLLKIKAWSTVRGSFECGTAEKQPVSIRKHGFVCSGLCVFCLFQFLFSLPPRPPFFPTGLTLSNVGALKPKHLHEHECCYLYVMSFLKHVPL